VAKWSVRIGVMERKVVPLGLRIRRVKEALEV
jgi:hypothetical protein